VRAPLLERLLARADSAVHVQDWRAHAWSIVAPGVDPPAIACGAWAGAQTHADRETNAGGWLLLATPVHLIAGLQGVSLAANGVLALSLEESARLAEEFNHLFAGGGARLVRGRGTLLLCLIDAPSAAAAPPATTDPETILGRDIGAHLPQGVAGAPLRRLMSELEMWLHDHALNEARRAREEPDIAGLWLWGGARAEERLPALDLWSHGEDPLFGAYEPRASFAADVRASGASGASGADRADRADDATGGARSGIIVSATAPGEAGFANFERDWLAPALADLRAGRIERLELSLGASSHRLGRRASYRVWRRARPWWSGTAEVGTDEGGIAREEHP